MLEKSLVDYAFDVITERKEKITFKELFDEVILKSKLSLSEGEIKVRMGKFYTQLSLDGRFVVLTDNNWDLRSNHLFKDVHIDMDDAYTEEEIISEDDEELESIEIDEESESEDYDKEKKEDIY